MNNHTTPAGILEQIAGIERMEAGKVCAMGQGKNGPYYNLQSRENGKTVTRYVSRDQVDIVREHTESYRRFQDLVGRYVQDVTARTREERLGGKKKAAKHAVCYRKKRSSS